MSLLRAFAAGFAISATLAILAGCGPPAPSLPVTVIANPGRFGSIESAAAAADSVDWWDDAVADDDACTESYAATELTRFLPGALGLAASDVRLAAGGALPARGDVIVLGTSASNALVKSLAGGPPAGEGDEAFQIRARSQGGRRVVVIEGATRRGTLAGTYALLDRLGVRFFDLGDSSTVFPARGRALPDRLLLDDAPVYRVRGFWAWEPRGSDELFRWMARNRMNLWTATEPAPGRLAQLGFRLSGGGHMIESDLLDPQGTPGGPARGPGSRTRFAAHPEWFGLEAGVRTPGIAGESGLNFCTSNAAAVSALAGGLVESLRSGAMRHVDLVSFWALDGGRWCTCNACRALGTPTDRWLAVTAAAAAAINSARRDGRLARPVTLMPPAYLESSPPPTLPAPATLASADVVVVFFPYFRCYAHALADPRCTEVNHIIMDRLRGWTEGDQRSYRGAVGIGEYYNVSWTKSLPVVMPHVMAADLAEYARLGVRHFSYMHAPSRRWGTWTLNHAVLARLLWNPNADLESMLEDFMTGEYPGAARDMGAFYAALERATANFAALQFTVGSIGTGNKLRLLDLKVPVYALKHLPAEPRGAGPDSAATLGQIEAAMAVARHALAAASSRPTSPLVGGRIAEVAARFAYGENMVRFWISLIRAADALRGDRPEEFQEQLAIADSAASELREVIDLVQVAASHANAANGLEASGAVRLYDSLREIERTELAR